MFRSSLISSKFPTANICVPEAPVGVGFSKRCWSWKQSLKLPLGQGIDGQQGSCCIEGLWELWRSQRWNNGSSLTPSGIALCSRKDLKVDLPTQQVIIFVHLLHPKMWQHLHIYYNCRQPGVANSWRVQVEVSGLVCQLLQRISALQFLHDFWCFRRSVWICLDAVYIVTNGNLRQPLSTGRSLSF